MPYAKDEAGHIWETDEQGNAIRLAQQAQPQMPANPKYPYEGPQAAATLGQTGATTAHTNAETQGASIHNRIDAATSADVIAKTRADAAKAQAEADAAAQKQLEAQKSERLRGITGSMAGDQVLNAVKQAKSHVGPWTTGLTGGVLGALPNLPGMDNQAYDLSQELGTIKSNTAFNEYKNLKESLPEGSQGGVRLLQQELDMLASLKGSLSQHNNPAHLNETLTNIDQSQRRATALQAGMDPFDPAVMQKLGINPVDPKSMAGTIYSGQKSGLTPQAAQAALSAGRADFNRQVARLPRAAQQIGLQKFAADPRIKQLQSVARGLTPPPRKQGGMVIDFNDLPER